LFIPHTASPLPLSPFLFHLPPAQVFDLFAYYVVAWRSDGSPAERWTPWSWLELAGFLLLVYGTFCYKELVPAPPGCGTGTGGGAAGEEEEEEEQTKEAADDDNDVP